MLDFLKIQKIVKNKSLIEISPKFIVGKRSEDLMIRGGDFYAIWDDENQTWDTDENRVVELVDRELQEFANQCSVPDMTVMINYMWDSDSGSIDKWHKYCQKQCRDSYCPLDEKIIFSNDLTKKEDHSSHRLSYPLEECDTPSYELLMSTLYDPEERHKLEWAIGAIVSGDSKRIQKFIVMYGSAGTGKSTVLNIVQKLFDGYYAMFDAKALGMANESFALEAFKNNPLIAIQHDGDLSKIEDNTRLNSIVSHEKMLVNEKHKPFYTMSFNAFLFMGTNKPVRITDAKSGILRRLIDVSPSGRKLNGTTYTRVVKKIDFELGGIAKHCLDVYNEDPGYYDNYVPLAMLGASNDFYNFIIDSFDVFDREDETTLKISWEMYCKYCEDAKVPYPYTQRVFKEELKNYFKDFELRAETSNGDRVRNYYHGFLRDKFVYSDDGINGSDADWLKMSSSVSVFDIFGSSFPAQYATSDGIPKDPWVKVQTTLTDIDTRKLHYVKVPENHIIIDFDIKDEYGRKSFKLNYEAASKWPKTYAELSKSGEGIHLHYDYNGDASKLCRIYDDEIEVKVFTGNASLRRKLTQCNGSQIATLGDILQKKGDNKVINFEGLKNEKAIRTLIKRNLNKEIWPNTRPSIDLIFKCLEDAYNSGMKFDVSDMRPAVLTFAMGSTHQAQTCVKIVSKMHFKSEEQADPETDYKDDQFIFFDVEVFPNLFVVVWKPDGKPAVRMINPKPIDIESLVKYKLIGFNNRSYDNHILYARMMGYTNEQLFNLSQRIIANSPNSKFGNAYNLSYTDIYDFCSEKKSLKKWEIELGIHHQEFGLPWDQPVPEELWTTVAEYCENDVIATEALFHAREGDFVARKILADVAEMTPNDTTNSLTTRIILGKNKNPNLVYTDLSKEFEGYEYVSALKSEDGHAHNMYRGEDVGFGGYVWAKPGMYLKKVVTFDVASMHPSSIIAMNYFGEYTQRFKEILEARIAIKHKDYDRAKKMLGGKLEKYLVDPSIAKSLAQALKIAINSVYGLTSASFDNPMRDKRNINNIVALRGALFMLTLRDEVYRLGGEVIHIKTDSIKIVDPSKEVYDFVIEFGKKYGYNFEIEHIFDRICLVNNAVYIAKLSGEDPDDPGKWTATGAQFQVPYVFKTLFSKEEIVFKDLCETKAVQTALYLDMNEGHDSEYHDYVFVGKVGLFCPIKEGCGGGVLLRKSGEDKYSSATGAKDFRWLEAEMVSALEKQDDIDYHYYDLLVDSAIETINQFGSFNEFIES